jgi:hypothetical protein
MGEEPGQDHRSDRTGVEGGVAAAARGNSTAFGYSIMITVTFAATNRIQQQGDILDYFGFAVGAAIAVGIVNGIVTRGFRRRLREVPAEVMMLGAAINFVSVVAAVAVGVGAAELLPELLGWTAAGLLASGSYVLLEGCEFWLADLVQAARGDPEAERRE